SGGCRRDRSEAPYRKRAPEPPGRLVDVGGRPVAAAVRHHLGLPLPVRAAHDRAGGPDRHPPDPGAVRGVCGAPLASEGLSAFFLESVCRGLWLFGGDRLSKRVHLATIWAV